MPKAYSWDLSAGLDAEVQQLIDNLKDTRFKESGSLFERFIISNNVNLELYDVNGQRVDMNLDTTGIDESDSEMESEFDESYNNIDESDLISEDYPDETDFSTGNYPDETNFATGDYADETNFSTEEFIDADSSKWYSVTFLDVDEEYRLYVIGNLREVNQAVQALQGILPWLILTIISVSILSSILYSYYLTRPMVKISQISKKMSQLDFNWYCDEKRTDEIGILAASLNELSDKLSTALRELTEANASLQDDIEKERELEQKRLEFFSAVSHELKTPITILKGQLEGMRFNVGAYKDRDKYLSHAFSVACSMEEIVQELLTVSRMESSDFVLKAQRFDLSYLLNNCIKKYEDLFMMKEIALNDHIEKDLTIEGDQKLLSKVINNIINNAATYSPTGSMININAYKEESKVILKVENTGVHISNEALPKLFEAFYRIEKSRNRSTGGSGLGLYIVKMILDLHHAEYKIENSEAGVLFTIQIMKE